MDFEVQHCTRHCHSTEREFAPDEIFYSLLVVGADVVRHDFCEAAWKGAPEGIVGWWKSKMPGPNPNKLHWAPSDVMLNYFEKIENDPDRQDLRYILALLLVRRRIVRLEDANSDEQQHMVLYCPRREKTYEVRTMSPHSGRVSEIQEELARLLFADAD